MLGQPFTCCISFVQRSMIGRTLSDFSGGNIGTTRATPRSLRRLSRSRSSARPNDVISIDAGSRPASRAVLWNSGIWAARSPRAVGIQPSP
jgi:hypothetical protein